MITITQHGTKVSGKCPVYAWAHLVYRIRSYKGTTDNTPVNTFKLPNGKLGLISSKQVREHLRTTVQYFGASRLGVELSNIGNHSIRTSCAMLLYLANVRTSTIMLIGRWKSDAFLLYIRRQVKEFTEGVTLRMIDQSDTFFSIGHSNLSTSDVQKEHFLTQDVEYLCSSNKTFTVSSVCKGSNGTSTSIVRKDNNKHTTKFHMWND